MTQNHPQILRTRPVSILRSERSPSKTLHPPNEKADALRAGEIARNRALSSARDRPTSR